MFGGLQFGHIAPLTAVVEVVPVAASVCCRHRTHLRCAVCNPGVQHVFSRAAGSPLHSRCCCVHGCGRPATRALLLLPPLRAVYKDVLFGAGTLDAMLELLTDAATLCDLQLVQAR